MGIHSRAYPMAVGSSEAGKYLYVRPDRRISPSFTADERAALDNMLRDGICTQRPETDLELYVVPTYRENIAALAVMGIHVSPLFEPHIWIGR
jgi:hypothetical protein